MHPNMTRLQNAIEMIRFGKITEIHIADGIPLRFRVEQMIDLSRDESVAALDQDGIVPKRKAGPQLDRLTRKARLAG
jgi:hypothetical protein